MKYILRPFKAVIEKTILKGCLNNTWHHFLCYLPERKGWVVNGLLKLFFSGIEDQPAQHQALSALPADAALVYVSKYHSRFEFLFYHTRYQQDGRVPPEAAFDHNILIWQPLGRFFRTLTARFFSPLTGRHWQDAIESGFMGSQLLGKRRALFLSLISQRGFQRRFIMAKKDPLRHLIELQRATERPVLLVPQIMFFGRTPGRASSPLSNPFFGDGEKTGFLRRLFILFRTPSKVFVEVSQPLNLAEYLASPAVATLGRKEQATGLRQYLLQQINRHRQSVTGPALKTTQELKEDILTNARMRKFMEQHAAGHSLPIRKVHKKAEGYMDEIAAKYSPKSIAMADMFLRWVFNLMFEGINVDQKGLARVKQMARKGPLVMIPCHKSHIDYLVLSYVMNTNNMPCPHIAAGKNLSFWPMGPIFRRGGAFFLRRKFKGAVLYTKVFGEYIFKLLREGFNIEIFIEGGRSRTGKLLVPKLGFISILLNAFRNGACDDLIFVPVFIGYDRVLEENAYLRELEGGEKEPENLWQVLQAGKFLKRKKWGRIYIKFDEPFSLKALLEKRGETIDTLTSKARNRLCRHIGQKAIAAIDSISIITPHALVAGALLNCRSRKIGYEELDAHIQSYLTYLQHHQAVLSDSLLIDPDGAVRQVVEAYLQRGFIEKFGDKQAPMEAAEFSVVENKRPSLEYYKNNCISFFVPAAITATAILANDAFAFFAGDLSRHYNFLQEMFQFEFTTPPGEGNDARIRKTLAAFTDDAILMPDQGIPDRYNLTAAGFRKLKRFSGFLKTYLESYRIALTYLALYPKNTVDAKRRLKKIESRGNRMFKRGEVGRKEALSYINYKNAVAFFNTKGISGAEKQTEIDHYMQEINRYLDRISM